MEEWILGQVKKFSEIILYECIILFKSTNWQSVMQSFKDCKTHLTQLTFSRTRLDLRFLV